MLRRPLLVSLAALSVVFSAPPAAQASLHFKRCGHFGYSCARMGVPLDWSGRVPGLLTLRVQRLRSRARPARGAVIVLAGGPGQSATAAFSGDGVGLLYPAFRTRDVIVFDQRGTGLSGALRCRALERANLLSAERAAAECAASLGARRGFYTTADSVEDVEAIRRQLGIERIALYGTSYGTKVALEYALRYPSHVERMALDSVLPADGPDPLYRDSFAATPRELRALCRNVCQRFTRDPVADLEALVGRVRDRPLHGVLVDSRGRRRRSSVSDFDVLGILLGGDFDPALRAAFPGAVRAALHGDAAPLVRLRRRALAVEGEPPPARVLSAGVYGATTCEETPFPWPRTTAPDPATRRRLAAAAVAALPDTTFRPFDRRTALASDLLTLCAGWPFARAAPVLGPGPLPNVPVLLIEGEDDLRTPVEGAERVAAQFPQAKLVVSPATGHSALGADSTPCARRAFDRFFRGGPVPVRCSAVRRTFAPGPPPPTRLSRVKRVRGIPGRRGRTVAAVGLTLRDVLEDSVTELIVDLSDSTIVRGGGLRAGSYRIGARGTLVLDRLEFVPGVRLNGRIRRFGERHQRGRVRVSGRGVPAGVLAVRGNRVRGALGGRRLRARLQSLSISPQVAAARAR